MLLNSFWGKSNNLKELEKECPVQISKKGFSTVSQSDENNIGVGTGAGKVNRIKIVAGLATSSVYYIFERKDDQVLKEKRELGKVQ